MANKQSDPFGGEAFESFRKAVDARLWATAGMGIDDLPDVCLRDWFDEGIPVATAARRALANAAGDDCDD